MECKLGLIGYPLGHSISAVIHQAGLKSLRIDASYDLIETPPEDLISRIKYLKTNNYTGFNVTIPLKVPMKLFLDNVDVSADVSGCVNTIKIEKNREFTGYNTDIYGFKKAIPEKIQKDLKGVNACVLGTGGAARAAAVGLIDLGVKQISFYSRNIINSAELAEYFRRAFPQVTFNLFQKSSKGHLFDSAIIVNSTPTGMKGHSADEMPLSREVIMDLPADTVIYDLVYNPSNTLLIKCAKEYGLETINGLEMLIHQAAKAQEIWVGKFPDVDKMKIAALENL